METLTIPLSEIHYLRLEKAAEAAGMSIEVFMCDWIKQLPTLEESETEIDNRVVAQANDDTAWEEPISVQRNFDQAAVARVIAATRNKSEDTHGRNTP